MRQARDGSVIRWGAADTPGPPHVVSPGRPAPITVAVSPVRPGHAVTVEYRANGGPVRQAMALPVPGAHTTQRAPVSGALAGATERTGRFPASPSLRRTADLASPHRVDRLPRYQVGGGAAPARDRIGDTARERGLISDAGCRAGGQAALGLEYQIALDQLHRYPQRGNREGPRWSAHQLVFHRWALRRAGSRGHRAWLGAVTSCASATTASASST